VRPARSGSPSHRGRAAAMAAPRWAVSAAWPASPRSAGDPVSAPWWALAPRRRPRRHGGATVVPARRAARLDPCGAARRPRQLADFIRFTTARPGTPCAPRSPLSASRWASLR
jgi:hypothetical protein